jgi:uncharacterized protein (DUF1330 family)
MIPTRAGGADPTRPWPGRGWWHSLCQNIAVEEIPLSDLPVTMLANLVIEDAEAYRTYEKGFFGILKKHGGTFLTFDDATVTFEGAAPPPGRLVIFRFPSEAAARAWYDDPDYQALSEHRRAGTTLQFLTMVHELPPRG